MSKTLLQRVAAGEMAAMQACMDEYGGLVWSLARRLCPSPSEAEDAVQEAFISLWENAERFDPEKGSEVTFVAMIARRRLIDRGRRYERRQRGVAQVKESEALPSPQTREPLADCDEARVAMKAMESLTPDQHHVLRLAIHHGLTHEQIAQATEMPLGTVKTHARRGLIRVRELLEKSKTQPAERKVSSKR